MDSYRSIWTSLYNIPHRLDWIDAAGVPTRYLEAGDHERPAIILLHGTAASLENFAGNIAILSRHFRVIALDMLGCGLTGKPDFDYQITDYAAHVGATMKALGVDSAAVIGVSLGSWVAARLAKDRPDLIERIVMVAPAGIVVDAEEEARVAAGIRARRGAAVALPTWETVTAAMHRLVLDPGSLWPDLIATRLAIYSRPETAAAMPHLLAFSLGGQHLSTAEWSGLAMPILCIAAVDAPNMFLKNARAIAASAPNAHCVAISGCDHWAQFEQPEAFHRACLPFLGVAPEPATEETPT